MGGMALILGAIERMVEYATRPPVPPVDRTLPIQPDNIEELIKQAKADYKMDNLGDFNVAVVGGQGVGKSALINGLRNMEDTHPDAVPVGVRSSSITASRSALIDALVLWELPGAGIGHPSLTYFTDKKLYAFDLILVVSDRFRRVDFEVARSALRLGRPCVFVRSKAELAVKRILEREKAQAHAVHVGLAMNMLRDDVQASFREGLRLARLPGKWTLFVVSSREYMNPRAYLAEQHEEAEDHTHMDEDKLLHHLANLLRIRARRSRRLPKLALALAPS